MMNREPTPSIQEYTNPLTIQRCYEIMKQENPLANPVIKIGRLDEQRPHDPIMTEEDGPGGIIEPINGEQMTMNNDTQNHPQG